MTRTIRSRFMIGLETITPSESRRAKALARFEEEVAKAGIIGEQASKTVFREVIDRGHYRDPGHKYLVALLAASIPLELYEQKEDTVSSTATLPAPVTTSTVSSEKPKKSSSKPKAKKASAKKPAKSKAATGQSTEQVVAPVAAPRSSAAKAPLHVQLTAIEIEDQEAKAAQAAKTDDVTETFSQANHQVYSDAPHPMAWKIVAGIFGAGVSFGTTYLLWQPWHTWMTSLVTNSIMAIVIAALYVVLSFTFGAAVGVKVYTRFIEPRMIKAYETVDTKNNSAVVNPDDAKPSTQRP